MNVKKTNTPFVILLIGVPMSGKSTWVKNNISTETIISRDQTLMEIYGSDDYNLAFNNVDQKLVNRSVLEKINQSVIKKENVIIDMTNISSKTRRRNLSYFTKDYNKIAIVFPILSNDEYNKRNEYRRINENKSISNGVLKNMIESFTKPTLDEGFNKIIEI